MHRRVPKSCIILHFVSRGDVQRPSPSPLYGVHVYAHVPRRDLWCRSLCRMHVICHPASWQFSSPPAFDGDGPHGKVLHKVVDLCTAVLTWPFFDVGVARPWQPCQQHCRSPGGRLGRQHQRPWPQGGHASMLECGTWDPQDSTLERLSVWSRIFLSPLSSLSSPSLLVLPPSPLSTSSPPLFLSLPSPSLFLLSPSHFFLPSPSPLPRANASPPRGNGSARAREENRM